MPVSPVMRGAHVRREAANHPEQLLHRRAASDHAAELEPPREIAFHGQHAAAPLDFLPHAGQELLEPAEIDRLAQVVHRPELDRLDGGVHRRVARHQHGLTLRVRVLDRTQHFQPANVRHPQIHHHQIGPVRLNPRDRVAPARAGDHLEPRTPRESPDHLQDAGLVIDDHEDRLLAAHTHSRETARPADRSARNS